MLVKSFKRTATINGFSQVAQKDETATTTQVTQNDKDKGNLPQQYVVLSFCVLCMVVAVVCCLKKGRSHLTPAVKLMLFIHCEAYCNLREPARHCRHLFLSSFFSLSFCHILYSLFSLPFSVHILTS
jgi:hypothetical protein